ncbi:MAG: DsrE family protein [Ginsengibacter sp.]
MRHLTLLLAFTLILSGVKAQSDSTLLIKNKNFKGATASRKSYRAIFQLDSNDPKIITKTIRNINNALNDPRLEGKLQLELIAFSGGTDAYLKQSPYEEDLAKLVRRGVIVTQCNNTLIERKIDPSEIYNFIAIVPSGVGELIVREGDGWAVIKP